MTDTIIMEYHLPVMLQECLEALKIKPDGIYLDLTFGGGGHSAAILPQLTTGKLIVFDQDPDAAKNIPDDDRFLHRHQPRQSCQKDYRLEYLSGFSFFVFLP